VNDGGTRELHVTYFPQRASAKIKNPQQLVLEVGVNSPWYRNNTLSIPFVRKDTNTWEAVLKPEEKDFWLYMIFMAKDEGTGQVDDNGGRYWDVVFYLDDGRPHFQGIQEQARSYTGVGFDNGIARAKDFAKATAILEEYVNGADPGRFNYLFDYWRYKVQRDGNNDVAWSKLNAEIDQFLDQHRFEMSALTGAANFIVNREGRLPPQLLPKMMSFIQAIEPKQAAKLDRMIAYARIQQQKDRRKKAEELRQFIKKYPSDPQTSWAVSERFRILRELGDVGNAESVFHQRVELNANWPDTYCAMAAVYIESSVKLDEALKLLDKAEELTKAGQQQASGIQIYAVLSPDPKRSEGVLAYWHARAYLQQGKGELALPLAQKALETHKNSDALFVAAQAYEVSGQTQQALDAYLQAVLLPSEKRAQQMERLEKLWISGGFGSKQQLQEHIRSLEDERFKKANYVPRLADHPVPNFEFVTLKGERFRSTDLREKTVVLNFWATWCVPCIPELVAFQELQAKHSDVVVATLAIDSEMEDVRKIIRQQKLDELRIARTDNLADAFVTQGLPVTYVIDRGRIRIVHNGAISDVIAYIEADLAALKKSPITAK
jgi:thiol-disulfide isomerase/thioredoxin